MDLEDGWVHSVTFPEKTSPSVEAFRLLLKFSKLDQVQLIGAALTDEHYAALARLKSLKHLDVSGSNFDDRGLAALAGKDLFGLWLTDTKITDAGLRHLTGMPRLYNLWLRGTQVTDTGLEALHETKSLEWVIVNETPVTARGINALKKALPKLQRTSK